MGLLRKKATAAAPAPAVAAVTIIARDTLLEGSLSLRGGVHVDGELRGEILSAEHTSIGTAGSFRGAIRARHVLVSGTFEGTIDCERLEITDTGLVIGEVVCGDLVIDGGGRFSGSRRARDTALMLPLSPQEPTRSEPELGAENEPEARPIPALIGSDKVEREEPAEASA